MSAPMVGTPGALRQPPPSAGNFGQGVAYPLTNNTQGRLVLSYGQTAVEQALQSIWETAKGERAMLPKFGCAMGEFEPTDVARMIAKLIADVREYEPRVDTIEATPQDGPGVGEVTVTVIYTLVGQANEHTLTFPIFVGP